LAELWNQRIKPKRPQMARLGISSRYLKLDSAAVASTVEPAVLVASLIPTCFFAQ
jgi:hypothetical protein